MKKIIIMFAIMFTAVFSNCEASEMVYLGESASQVYSLDTSNYEVVNGNDYIMNVATYDRKADCICVIRMQTDRVAHTYTMLDFLFIKDDMAITKKQYEVRNYTDDSLVARAIDILDKLEGEAE